MNDEAPKTPPIEEVIKQVLLSKREIPDWLPKPQEIKSIFETVWYFDKMTPEEIAVLDKNRIGSILSKLETEQQDYLVKRLPKTLESEFWGLVRQFEDEY